MLQHIFKQTTFKGIRDVIIKKKQEVIKIIQPQDAKDEEIKQKAKAKGDKLGKSGSRQGFYRSHQT